MSASWAAEHPNVAFDFRIVAKRTGHEAERMTDATGEMRLLTKPRDNMEARRAKVASTKHEMPVQKNLPGLLMERAPQTHSGPPAPAQAQPRRKGRSPQRSASKEDGAVRNNRLEKRDMAAAAAMLFALK